MGEFVAVFQALFIPTRKVIDGALIKPPKEGGYDDDENEVTKVHDNAVSVER